MRGTPFNFLTLATTCAVLLAGCEWSSSGGDSSWSGSYDDMNFSATYRIGVTTSTDSFSTSTDTETKKYSVSETVGTYAEGKFTYSGKLHGGVVAGSVTITAGGYIYSDNGSGVLVGNLPVAGNGTVNYESGAWGFSVETWTGNGGYPNSGNIIGVYAYTDAVSGGGTDSSVATAIKGITISQNGQYLTMTLTNGVKMTGRFGTVNEIVSSSGTGYNAQFEVSSSGNKMTGTLDSSSGTRVLDGVWISGSNYYDIHGTGGAVQAGRTNVVE